MIYEYNSFLKEYIQNFLLQQKSIVTDFTYAHRCGILRNFDEFVINNDCKDINFTESQVLQWIASLNGKRATINSYINVIRVFFKFLAGYGFHPFQPQQIKPHNDYIAYEFSDEELKQIFLNADLCCLSSNPNSATKSHPTTKYFKLKYELPMILRIILGCGLRLEEATTIQLKDIDFDKDVLTIKKTKSKEYRIVPMSESLTTILAQYCKSMGLGLDNEAYIFPGTNFSKPIPSFCIRNHFNHLLKKSNILVLNRKKHERGMCIHCFRHTFAHKSFKKGLKDGWAINDQIPWLSVYLGHKNLRETEKYLKFNSEIFNEEIKMFDKYSQNLFPEVMFDE